MERVHVSKANGRLKQNYYVVNHKLEEWFIISRAYLLLNLLSGILILPVALLDYD